MPDIAYHASHEQFAPSELLRLVQRAEEAGFTAALSSDHLHPWTAAQGHSGFAWSWLGAALARTKGMRMGVVNAPGWRYHPVIIAQAAATLAEMFPGRFFLCSGSGEAINEHVTGQQWPPKPERNAHLRECVDVMRALWAGEEVTHHGRITVEQARVWSLPATPPLLVGAGVSAETVEWLGGWADAVVTVARPREELQKVIDAWHRGGGEGKPMFLKVQVAYDTDREVALRGAFEQWRSNIFPGDVLWELRTPKQFEQAGVFTRPEDLEPHVRISADTAYHADELAKDFEMGFELVSVHNVHRAHDRFIDDFGARVLPELPVSRGEGGAMSEGGAGVEGRFLWWQKGAVYQVYPRSYQDTNGDGVGDLRGIIERLDHLVWLGVDAVWISPIFPSPMADFGYDVADYRGIHPLFGAMDEFDELLRQAHARGLKVILDFVPNHSSARHPWFVQSRESRDNPKRDWYIWRDAAPDGGPPNNWLSVFGGSAWEWDEATGQYYYHAFLAEQPDLNWRNPEVVDAMLGVLRFWLDLGVDGFRVDVLWHLIKDDQFRDNPVNPDWKEGQDPFQKLVPLYTTDRPEVHDVITRMRGLFDAYDARVLIGEIYLPVEKLVEYYGTDLQGAHLPFNFQLVTAQWDARHIAGLIAEYEAALPEGGWPNWVLGNHDQSRIATRVGAAQARVAAMLLLTLRGTPTVYYGDEIGMDDVPISPEQVQDPFEKRVPGLGLGRDPERTPMQWDASAKAGFTTGEPWLPIADDFEEVNVEAERDDPASMLSLHRRLLALRREEKALAVGDFRLVDAEGSVLAYVRESGGTRFLVALNLGDAPQTLRAPSGLPGGVVAVATHHAREGGRVDGDVALRGDEGVVVRLDG